MAALAVLSATIAALTAIFAKIGIENINSDFATFIRTIVILVVVAGLLALTGQWQSPATVSGRTYAFWCCQAAPPARPGFATSVPSGLAMQLRWLLSTS